MVIMLPLLIIFIFLLSLLLFLLLLSFIIRPLAQLLHTAANYQDSLVIQGSFGYQGFDFFNFFGTTELIRFYYGS